MKRRSLRVPVALACAAAGSVGLFACSGSDDEAPTPHVSNGGGAGEGGAGGGGAGGSSSVDASGAVRRYDIELSLEDASAHSSLTVDLAPPGGNCLEIACELPVTEPTWNGEPATSSDGADGVVRTCGSAIDGGQPLVLGLATQIPEATFLFMDVGFSRQPSRDGGTFSYLLSWLGGCDHTGPCDDDPGTLAEFSYVVTHDPATTVLCPGERTTESGRTECRIESVRAPTYSAYALMADTSWVRTPLVEAAGVDLVFYEPPTGVVAASLSPDRVAEAFGWLVARLGPYPYGSELRIATGPTYWLGFEHPANILLSEDLPLLDLDYADGSLHVLVHEMVHQWAGNRVTVASEVDFVWKEAIAEYLTYVFEDEQLAGGEAAASLAYWDRIARFADYHPRPTDEPLPAVEDFYGDAYGPGPMVFFVQLETMLGRPVVLAAIESFLEVPGVKAVADLQLALEAASSEELGPYFDAWVYGAGTPDWPAFVATAEQVGDVVTVTLTQQSDSAHLFGCAVEVLVVGATTSALTTVDFGLAPTSAEATATATLAEPVTGLVVDPDHRVIDVAPSGAGARSGKATLATEGGSDEPERPRVWLL